MPSARTVDQFFRETTRQAIDGAASMQDASIRYWNEWLNASRGYVDAWLGLQQSGMRATFDVQNASLAATRNVFDAILDANRTLADHVMKTARQQQTATSKLVAAGSRIAEAGIAGKRS